MKTKVLLDTNIFLDIVAMREDVSLSQESALLVQNLNNSGLYDLYISAISIPTIAYVLKKREAEAKKQIIGQILGYTTILAVGEAEIKAMLRSDFSDLEDALQAYCASLNGCEAIVTRNTKHYKTSPIPAYTPAEFIRLVSDSQDV